MTWAAASGRPKQGPTLASDLPELVEGAPYSASGVSSRAAAPGRPKQGPTLSEGRSPYSASGVLS